MSEPWLIALLSVVVGIVFVGRKRLELRMREETQND